MRLLELKKRLDYLVSETSSKSLYYEMYKYIKNELQGVILNMNKSQLFKYSQDTDGNPLGFYSYEHRQRKRAYSVFQSRFQRVIRKDIGAPFTMVETGRFRDNMFINVYYRNIEISSDVEYLDIMYRSGNFFSTKFFGLTERNIRTLNRLYILPHLQKWLRQQLQK